MSTQRERLAELLPAYDIGQELGRGAFGVVVGAVHRGLGRQVAVKQLWRTPAADPAVQHRFTAEARVLATLDHPHIVQIYDFVEQQDVCLFVMELLPGGTVRDRAAREGISAQAACGLAIATCTALQYAHARGVLHRDIKPDNLMFNGAGVLRVTDFGIAKVFGATSTMQTMAGAVIGTPAYMAPEQASGATLSTATDVYALGTVLYELLAGQLPLPVDDNPLTVLYRHVHERPRALSEVAPFVPAPIVSVVMRALEIDPSQRQADAEELGIALADAAQAAWGPGWVEQSGQQVIASGKIAAHLSAPPASIDWAASGGAPVAPVRTRDQSGPRRRGPRRLGRRGLVAGIAALVVAIAAVLAVALTRGGGGGTPIASTSTSTGARSTPTPTPPATPSPTPAAVGRVVFTDPLTSPLTGWAPDAGQTLGAAAFQPDGYHVRVLQPLPALNTFSLASPYAPRLTSLAVAATVAFIAGAPADGAGVRCDQGGRAGLRYSFEVRPDGSWFVFRIDDTGAAPLQQGNAAPAATYHVTGSCTDDAAGVTRLALTINGVSPAPFTDAHPGGPIAWHAALVASRDQTSPGMEVRFTEFTVTDLHA